jgi:hypothetical protein
MLWQPLHSATPPEWNAWLLLAVNSNIANAAKNVNPNDFDRIFLPP